jgi:hypothetical protein
MRREAGEHENFFIAKNRDSESAQRAFESRQSVAISFVHSPIVEFVADKMPAAQAFPATLTIDGTGCSHPICIAAPMVCRVLEQRASRAPALVRQHFLKQDAVFLDVLVYSGCSASRFPSARSD